MVSQAQLEFTQAFRELKSLSRRDFTQGVKLAKFKKIAGSMLKNDPVTANTLQGLVACLEHDIASMHAYHKAAIEIAESCFSLMFYAASLEKSCLWNESARFALLALDHDPLDLNVLHSVIKIAPLTGRFSLLKRLLAQWQQAHAGVSHPRHRDCEMVGELLAKNGLLEKDLKGVLAAIGDALSETDLVLLDFSYLIVTETEERPFIHYQLVIPDQFVASYYEDLIADKLAAVAFHPRIFDAFSFSIENSTVYELYDYMERELEGNVETIRLPDPAKMKLIEELVAGVEI